MKSMASHFLHLHNTPHNTPYLKNRPEYIGYSMILLNSVKILTVQSVENFKFSNLPVFGLTPALPVCGPACQL